MVNIVWSTPSNSGRGIGTFYSSAKQSPNVLFSEQPQLSMSTFYALPQLAEPRTLTTIHMHFSTHSAIHRQLCTSMAPTTPLAIVTRFLDFYQIPFDVSTTSNGPSAFSMYFVWGKKISPRTPPNLPNSH